MLAVLAACLPSPRGQCQADADCAGGAAGLFCADGICQSLPSATLSEVPVKVLGRSQTATVRVRVERARGAPVLSLSLAGAEVAPAAEPDGVYRFDVPLTLVPARTEGTVPFSVSVTDDLAHPVVLGGALLVDDLAPRISIDPLTLPGAAVVRGTRVSLRVTLSDLTPSTLSFAIGGASGAAAAQADGSFVVPVDTSAAAPAAAAIEVALAATDAVGNVARRDVSFPITRLRWKAQEPSSSAIVGLALVASEVVATTLGSSVMLIDRTSGLISGSPHLGAGARGNVATDGTFFYASRVDSQFCKIGLDGTTRWCCGPLGILVGGAAIGPLPATHGALAQTAIVATANGAGTDGKRLYAFRDATDGSCDAKPTPQLANFRDGAPSIATDGTIYSGGVQAVIAAQFDGLTWTTRVTPESASYLGQPALRAPSAQGEAALFATQQGFVDFLGFPSAPLAGAPADAPAQASGDVIYPATSATLASDGTAVVGTQDSRLVAFTPAGAVRWSVALPSAPTAAPTQGAGDVLYVGTLDGTLFALALGDGSVLWSFAAGAPLRTPPALGCDGTLYFGADSGAVFALATDSAGLAESPWPREGHDVRGTGDARRALRSTSGACQE